MVNIKADDFSKETKTRPRVSLFFLNPHSFFCADYPSDRNGHQIRSFLNTLRSGSCFFFFFLTRTLSVALSLACLDISFFLVSWLRWFFFGIQKSVICRNVNTQNVKIASRDRPHILASHRCEAFENLLHIDIAPVRTTLSGILHSKH